MVRAVVATLMEFVPQVKFEFEIPGDLPDTYIPKQWKHGPNEGIETQTGMHQPNYSSGHSAKHLPGLRPIFKTIDWGGRQREVVGGELLVVVQLDNGSPHICRLTRKNGWRK